MSTTTTSCPSASASSVHPKRQWRPSLLACGFLAIVSTLHHSIQPALAQDVQQPMPELQEEMDEQEHPTPQSCFQDVISNELFEEATSCELLSTDAITLEESDAEYRLTIDVSSIDMNEMEVDLGFEESNYGRLLIMGQLKPPASSRRKSKARSSPSSSSSSSSSSSRRRSSSSSSESISKNCVYRQWQIETDRSQDAYVDIHDLTMGMDGPGMLRITAPKPHNNNNTETTSAEIVPEPRMIPPNNEPVMQPEVVKVTAATATNDPTIDEREGKKYRLRPILQYWDTSLRGMESWLLTEGNHAAQNDPDKPICRNDTIQKSQLRVSDILYFISKARPLTSDYMPQLPQDISGYYVNEEEFGMHII